MAAELDNIVNLNIHTTKEKAQMGKDLNFHIVHVSRGASEMYPNQKLKIVGPQPLIAIPSKWINDGIHIFCQKN